METKQQPTPMNMKHTSPHFWQYAFAYIGIGSGTFLILATVAELALGEEKWSALNSSYLAGCGVIIVGVMSLTNLKRLTSKGPAPDNTEVEN